MADGAASSEKGVTRRRLLIGGGAGVGLIVAWTLWPRSYSPNLAADKGETVFGAWIKIASDGRVTVAVPQCEHGQGVYTAMPQIVADELGADWKTVAVEAAPINPLYANGRAAEVLFGAALDALPQKLRETYVTRSALMLTGGSTSIRNFEEDLRHAGAAARILLCKAAARRWNVDWRACGTTQGQVVRGDSRLGFGELAEGAVREHLPEQLPLRESDADRLYGRSVPRLDVPAKVDGSANFTADVRLPGMVFASVRQGPTGDTRLAHADEAAANGVRGMISVVSTDRWIAAVANNWWAADRALNLMKPRFRTPAQVVNDDSIDDALTAALDGDGRRMAEAGDLEAAFKGARVVTAEYRVGLALHAAIEPMTATAEYREGRLSLWLPTQAPALARTAAAHAAGISEANVVVHPMLAGGSFGANLEHQAAEQAAVLAVRVGRPVQLTWSRTEDFRHDRYRTAAAARMTGRLDGKNYLDGWLAKIAAPATGRELAERLLGGPVIAAALAAAPSGDSAAVAGAVPPYAIPNYAVDHHPATIGVPTGYWRSAAHSYTCFFTESFLDEMAHVAGVEAFSFRMELLGKQARLARCLQRVTQIGGWQGGGPGTGQGIACHAFRGSHVAVLAEAHLDSDRKVRVERLVAVVDCGRVVNPALVRQQIEGGLIFGMAAALGASTGFTENVADVRNMGELGLPTLADAPEVTVEIIPSQSDPGGVAELAVPPVAPAIANALQASTGVRFRRLPLLSDVE